jgi:hypothetical protein
MPGTAFAKIVGLCLNAIVSVYGFVLLRRVGKRASLAIPGFMFFYSFSVRSGQPSCRERSNGAVTGSWQEPWVQT